MQRSTLAQRLCLLELAILFFPAVSFAAQTQRFTVQLLGNIEGGMAAYASDVNDAEEAVGIVGLGTSICPDYCAAIWHDGTPTLLQTPAGMASGARAINNASQVAGYFVPISSDLTTAVVWSNGTPTVLPAPAPQFKYSAPSGINDAGQVAGSVTSSDETKTEAVVWNGVTPTLLGTGTCASSYATAINSKGTVTGLNFCSPSSNQAVVWHGTTVTLLGDGSPNSIDDTGLIVGLGPYGATAWVDGSVIKLLGTRSTASAVNKRGSIVGKEPGPRYSYHAALWSSVSAAPQDLNMLIGTAALKYVLVEAVGINSNCTIVANGFSTTASGNLAFLLKPVDPSSCAKGL